MLLNEFLKEHKRVEAQQSNIEKQEATIAELKSAAVRQQKNMDVLTARLKEQAAQIQKVSTQMGISRSTTTVTFNDPWNMSRYGSYPVSWTPLQPRKEINK